MIENRPQEPLLIADIAPNGTVVQRTEPVKQSHHIGRWAVVVLGILIGIWPATALLIGGVVAGTGHSVWITVGNWRLLAGPYRPPTRPGMVRLPAAIMIGSLSLGPHICSSRGGGDFAKVDWAIQHCSAPTLEPLSPPGQGGRVISP